MKRLKVYGFMGYRKECPPAANGNRQTREIVACTAWTTAAQLSGSSLNHIRTYGAITGNPAEVAVAMANPGVVFWTPSHSRHGLDVVWTRVEKDECYVCQVSIKQKTLYECDMCHKLVCPAHCRDQTRDGTQETRCPKCEF